MKKLLFLLVFAIYLYPQMPLSWVKVDSSLYFKTFSIWKDSVFLTYSSYGFYTSTNNGNSWNIIPTNLPLVGFALTNEINGHIFAVGYDSLFRLDSDINSWNYIGSFGGTYSDFITDDLDNIYFSTSNGLVKKTSVGDTLKKVINTPVVSTTWDNTGKMLFAVTNERLYRSSNYGNSFTDITPSIATITQVFYDDYNKLLYILRNGGIYKSIDAGNSWVLVPNQSTSMKYFVLPKGLIFRYLPDVHAGETFFHYSISKMLYWTSCNPVPNFPWGLAFLRLDKNGYIYHGHQHSKGLFKSIVPLNAVVDVNENDISGNLSFSLKQNYPNPFNPETNILFDLKSEGNVKLKVINTLGQIVEVLLDEHLSAGSHKVRFNATNLPSGIYFYSIEAEGFRDTKKMVLIR